jgi:predicted glycosyltransferase
VAEARPGEETPADQAPLRASVHIGYYVHHHGHGHYRRAEAIAKRLRSPVTLIGSDLPASLPAPLQRLDLPGDTAPGMQVESFATLHYAPLAVDGLRARMTLLAQWLHAHWPCLLVVDVSVEVALLARLLGVPTVYVRQHGQRDDAAHLQAYASASALLAPWPALLETLDSDAGRAGPTASAIGEVISRTRYSGWLSRYPQGRNGPSETGRVLVIIGQGGTAMGAEQLVGLANACPALRIRVMGLRPGTLTALPGNLEDLGHVGEPYEELCRAEIVIGSAGDGVVAEVASLGCHFIAITEERPFAEQLQQARRLDALGLAIGLPAWPDAWQWPELIARARRLDPQRWARGAMGDTAANAARIIEAVAARQWPDGATT